MKVSMTWPGLASKLGRKHLLSLIESSKGNIRAERSNLLSIKVKTLIIQTGSPSTIAPQIMTSKDREYVSYAKIIQSTRKSHGD